MIRPFAIVACLALLPAACARPTATPTTPAPLPAAPWQNPPLAASRIPSVYVQQWSKAQNKSTCALFAFADVGQAGQGASPRAATFSGGWAVAYDLPDLRSAFGVAGAGVQADEPAYDEWPHHITWSDGSSAGYGPEGGGAGPNQLAYLRIAGQGCLYNVWSRLGVPHLEQLLAAMRRVTDPGSGLN